MGTWAAVTKLDAAEAQPTARGLEASDISVAVVDTNAIISGLQLHRIAETAVTIPEVLSEVRDKRTRQYLANLPFALQCQQPSEESVKAVLRFARATGDLHSLSTADIRLIALAHTLEVARHGDVALRALPDLPSVRRGNPPAAKELPGWNETGDKWADMDRLAEEDLAEQELAGLLSKMGLRLVAPNGMRIKQLSRWVLRCSACFKITKEPGRLFCPHCGNSTLEKVEAVIGPDGTEQYGVRKRFNTRGTRYSLPKPKGGYQKNAPILREDVLMQKLNKRRNRKPKDEAVDAFAPEYGPDSWFQKNHGSAAQYKGAASALASWKHNPNERRHTRTNRRKK
ncbi:hypothetical protein WJX82_009412 [Trebouxia sp. C0006]